jgi:hypothetical protein
MSVAYIVIMDSVIDTDTDLQSAFGVVGLVRIMLSPLHLFTSWNMDVDYDVE